MRMFSRLNILKIIRILSINVFSQFWLRSNKIFLFYKNTRKKFNYLNKYSFPKFNIIFIEWTTILVNGLKGGGCFSFLDAKMKKNNVCLYMESKLLLLSASLRISPRIYVIFSYYKKIRPLLGADVWFSRYKKNSNKRRVKIMLDLTLVIIQHFTFHSFGKGSCKKKIFS